MDSASFLKLSQTVAFQDAMSYASASDAHTTITVISTGKTVKVYTWFASKPSDVEETRVSLKDARTGKTIVQKLAAIAFDERKPVSFNGYLRNNGSVAASFRKGVDVFYLSCSTIGALKPVELGSLRGKVIAALLTP